MILLFYYFLLASLLLQMNKTVEAILHYQEAIKLAPDQVEAYIGIFIIQISSILLLMILIFT